MFVGVLSLTKFTVEFLEVQQVHSQLLEGSTDSATQHVRGFGFLEEDQQLKLNAGIQDEFVDPFLSLVYHVLWYHLLTTALLPIQAPQTSQATPHMPEQLSQNKQ